MTAYKLIRTADNTDVKVGDKVTSFRGEVATVTGWPTTGWNRVWVKWDMDEDGTGEYFPNVFDLKLVEA
jgi:hypothetical protein